MRLQQVQDRINELMSMFVTQVKGYTAMSRQDINRISETVLIPLFAEIYGYKNLQNLNYTEGPNYPGIDLGDKKARVAFQITATPSSDKVKDTLVKFVRHKLYTEYDHLIIYILKEKQNLYAGSYDEIIQGRFSFDKNRDIRDYRDILTEVANFQIEKALIVQDILERNFGQRRVPQFGEVYVPQTETVYLNLLELTFPNTLYTADLDIDRKEVIRNSRRQKIRLLRTSPPRKIAQAALKQAGIRFAVDWECHERLLITFHNLEDGTLPLARIIDPGTVTPLAPEEFYGVDENYERVFKSLLRRCMQQKLYQQQVLWQNKDHLFIFGEVDGTERRVEQWQGKKESERTVYVRKMKNNKPDEILNCEHFAFRVRFKRFGTQWYVVIKPDWFFSYDGYHRSRFGA
jgi:hypothetical protein